MRGGPPYRVSQPRLRNVSQGGPERSFNRAPYRGPPQGPPQGGPSMVPPACTQLKAGLYVQGTCIRVWPRYAMLQLLPQQGPPGAPETTQGSTGAPGAPQGPIGFLHVSGIRRNGGPLAAGELRSFDLTTILSAGASCTVRLLKEPSAETSNRWQLALYLPGAAEPGPPGAPSRGGPLRGPSAEGDTGEVEDPSSGGPQQADYGYGGGPSEEEYPFRGGGPLDGGPFEGTGEDGGVGVLEGLGGSRRRQRSASKGTKGPRSSKKGGAPSRWVARDRDREVEEDFFNEGAPTEDLAALGIFDDTMGGPQQQGPLPHTGQDTPLAAATVAATEETAAATAATAERETAAEPAIAGTSTAASLGPRVGVRSSSKWGPSRRQGTAGGAPKRGAPKGGPPPPEEVQPRPAVVTVLGHVDHGKTTLLAALKHISKMQEINREGGPPGGPPTSSRRLGTNKEALKASKGGPFIIKEAGGITQRIGCFQVLLPASVSASVPSVTFLDTPGHGAFSCMRLRAAKASDVVLLVVAANEGLQQETKHCIQACKDLSMPVVVVITKTDLMGGPGGPQRGGSTWGAPGGGPLKANDFLSGPAGARLLSDLAGEGLLTEPLGGPIQVVAVNAKGYLESWSKGGRGPQGAPTILKGAPEGPLKGPLQGPLEGPPEGPPEGYEDPYGMEKLLECIAIQGEEMSLLSSPYKRGRGVVLESTCSKTKGGSAVILIKEGTIKVGDWLVAGDSICRVKSLRRPEDLPEAKGAPGGAPGGPPTDSTQITAAAVSEAAEVFGFASDSLPSLGEEIRVVNSEAEAKREREETILPVTVRAGSQGPAAAVAAALEGLVAYRVNPACPWVLGTPEGPPGEGAPHGGKRDSEDDEETVGDEGDSSSSSTSSSSSKETRQVKVIKAAAGECTPKDVINCIDEEKRGGILIAFATKVAKDTKRAAEAAGVQLICCDVIYDALHAVQQRLLSPQLFGAPGAPPGAPEGPGGPGVQQNPKGNQARVKQVFPLSNVRPAHTP
ncbi:elongation factor Tu GTP binding domain-containing protein, putative [Eimeria maxima]|uniref:Elongation factor Tu GTP binding domain-containing protein, putative n=1 Tax=Eimeria maxima TaxID=5804 RepID=U6M1X5_EIMMA|nr:elongation factor Tu GTP binding domain-containing protein, putative [Eimeria maxima]CDJ57048.1 elongation factor Tu GTP binding domain-containing protein, putative [Eimeria maxima]